jgi:gliding motility-associated-like protein
MKTFKYQLLLIFCFITIAVNATHIVGGELNYRCLGNDTYEISLTVFRDCQNGIPQFDDPAAIGVFDSSNTFLFQSLIPFIGDDTLNPTLFDSCLVIPPDVCVHRTTYIDTLFLPFITGGYQLSYQRCCRNYTIINIQTPDETGATYYTQLSESALMSCNSNAVFNAWPPVYICAGEPILFDHSATDIDGDSLVYELCAPFDDSGSLNPQPQPPLPPPYDSISWQSPFSTNNMLGGTDLLAIDSETGFLTGTPTQEGQYVVGVCVLEYRNGEIISSTKRDFQYNVGVCGQINNAAFFVPTVVCDSNLTVSFNNQSNTSLNLFWNFGDGSTLNDTSSIFSPTYTYPDTGQYLITLIAGEGFSCADTFSRIVSVHDATLEADFEVNYDPCEDSTMVQLINTSFNPNSAISGSTWNLWNGESDTTENPVTTIFGQDFYQFALFTNSENGCFAFKIDTIYTNPVNIRTEADSQICRGSEMYLEVFNLDSTDNLSYQWFPDEQILDGQNTNLALVAPILTTTYEVEATNQFGCTGVDTILVINSSIFPPLQVQSSVDSVFPGGTVQLDATYSPNYIYDWQPDSSLTINGTNNPKANPYVPTAYTLVIEDENGCKNADTIFVRMKSFECELPYIFIPTAFTPNNDGNNDEFFVRANSITDVYLAIYNRWGQRVFETTNLKNGWDGTFNGMPLESAVFGYYLEIECYNGQTHFQKGNISLIR